jgi:hypothetical protein
MEFHERKIRAIEHDEWFELSKESNEEPGEYEFVGFSPHLEDCIEFAEKDSHETGHPDHLYLIAHTTNDIDMDRWLGHLTVEEFKRVDEWREDIERGFI